MTKPRPAASTWGEGDSRSLPGRGPVASGLPGSMGRHWQQGEPTQKTTPTTRQGGRVQRPGESLGHGLGAPKRTGLGWGRSPSPSLRRASQRQGLSGSEIRGNVGLPCGSRGTPRAFTPAGGRSPKGKGKS